MGARCRAYNHSEPCHAVVTAAERPDAPEPTTNVAGQMRCSWRVHFDGEITFLRSRRSVDRAIDAEALLFEFQRLLALFTGDAHLKQRIPLLIRSCARNGRNIGSRGLRPVMPEIARRCVG
jgi:hypothetical protein